MSGESNYAANLERERRGDRVENVHTLDLRELGPFLDAMDQYTPTIPEEVTGFYLQQAGVTFGDERIKKIVSLAAEKLISEIVHDTTTYSRMKEQGGELLKMDDLVQSLKKYGIKKLQVVNEAQDDEDGGHDAAGGGGGGGGAEAGGGGAK